MREPTTRPAISLPMAAGMAIGAFLLGLLLRYFAYLTLGASPSLPAYADHMCRWDCRWYLAMAETGYTRALPLDGTANWAYFPLFPWLLGLLQRLTGLFPPVNAMLLGAIAIVWATIAARRLVESPRAYLAFALLLLAGPTSFYFTSGYSESLFIFFTVLGFVALRRQHYVAAGLAGALLSATRVVGVLFALAMLVEAFVAHRRGGGTLAGFPRAVLGNGRLLLGLALAPAGLFAYMAFLYATVGHPLAFLHAQAGWGRVVDWPWTYLIDAVTHPRLDLTAQAATAVLGIAGGAFLARREQWPEAVFVVLALLVPLSSGLFSLPRFVFGLAPLYLLCAHWLAGSRRAMALILAAGMATGCWVTLRWIAGAGYLV